ncbi:MAG TPA: NADH-quinone oxidoreductase subunit H, partial [Armatimonadota bacterium]|nr:NADH-quinone oxidoreductase subunit H [Armatimonadota bacterium]
FGGWSGLGWFDLDRLPAWLGWYSTIAPTVIFFTKQMVFMVGAIWVRATLPRMRYDQLMNLGWKVLIPVATANLVALALFEAASQRWF